MKNKKGVWKKLDIWDILDVWDMPKGFMTNWVTPS